MASFALYLQSDTFASPTLASCLRFAKAAIASGHQIDHIFLYHAAVQAIVADVDLPADEPDQAQALAEYCQQQQIPLLYCVTAAEKRGFASQHKPARAGYTAAGLAEFSVRLAQVDRLIQF
jgi:tRNA 2-thiouridine synthesizing protein D